MKKEISKIMCFECNKNTNNGLNGINDFHGNTFAFCCDTCRKKINKMLDILFTKYGGVKNKCSPIHSPHIQDTEQLKREIS